ncbi:hypothetical protein LTR84_008802 [Exophiala bonariae]|uniref:Transcription factor domain-containing protein n=1 Tax=Exophiala bonariae TaxID=1690606 RepID=A0AAV9MWC8_9EURO|nr:hypothetical protein LTR84_008802 [Exophiala bonariae]
MPPFAWINYTDARQPRNAALRHHVYSHVGKYFRNRSFARRTTERNTMADDPGPTNSRPESVDPPLLPEGNATLVNNPDPEPETSQPRQRLLQSKPTASNKISCCLGSLGPICTNLSNYDATVLHYYLEQSLILVFNHEFRGIVNKSALSHRFFPVLSNTAQCAMQDKQLLDSLLSVTAYLMTNVVANYDTPMNLGHQASYRALRRLRTSLSISSTVQFMNNLHTMLHLCMGAYHCGEIDVALLHLRALLRFERQLSAQELWAQCIWQTLRMYDVYIAAENGQFPMMAIPGSCRLSVAQDLSDSHELSLDTAVALHGSSTTAGSWRYAELVKPCHARSLETRLQDGATAATMHLPNEELPMSDGFSKAIRAGIISRRIGQATRQYLELAEFANECMMSASVDMEALEWSHQRTVSQLHELCILHKQISIDQSLNDLAVQAKPYPGSRPTGFAQLTQATILAIQIDLFVNQGPWLGRATRVLLRRLRRCLDGLNPRSCSNLTEVDLSPDARGMILIHQQLRLWIVFIGILAANDSPDDLACFENQAVCLTKSLGIHNAAAISSILNVFGATKPYEGARIHKIGQLFARKYLL